jgi:hypothetical protein
LGNKAPYAKDEADVICPEKGALERTSRNREKHEYDVTSGVDDSSRECVALYDWSPPEGISTYATPSADTHETGLARVPNSKGSNFFA